MPDPLHRTRGLIDPKEADTVDSSANHTTATKDDVDVFVAGLPDDQRQRDAQTVLDLMREVNQEPPVMWVTSILGLTGKGSQPQTGGPGQREGVDIATCRSSG
jgi:hypothetical protein